MPNSGFLNSILIRQGIVGAACFSLNVALMWSLVALAALPILIATAICFFLVNAVGHHMSRIFVFKSGESAYSTSLLRYVLVMAASFILNLSAMATATQWLDVHYLAASAMIAAAFFIGNFLAHREWTFR